jgi:hypothetical protein
MCAHIRAFHKPLSCAIIFFAGFLLSASSNTIRGQSASTPSAAWVDDWTHHHLVFSNPGSAAEAIARGRFEQWLKITQDPRYRLQQLKRSLTQRAVSAAPDFSARQAILSNAGVSSGKTSSSGNSSIQKDWSAGLDGADESAVGTVNTNNATSASSITVGSATIRAGAPVAATASGTFSGAPTANQTATITNGSNVLTLTVGGTAGTGTLSVTARPGTGTNTLTVGTLSYSFESYCGFQTNCISRPFGYTDSQYAGNIYAALADNSSYCTTYGTGSGCFAHMTSNTGITLGTFTAHSSTSFTVTNTTGTSLPFSSTATGVTAAGGPIPGYTGSNACSSSTAGTFVLDTNTTNLATNLAAAISTCNSHYSTVGVTAASSGAVVTVTAAAAGGGGNNIALGETLTGFAWSGADLTGGSDGTSATTFGYEGLSTSQVAADIATAINENTTLEGSGGVTATASGNTVTVTSRTTGTGTVALGVTSFSGFSWNHTELAGGATGTGAVQPNAYPAMYGASFTSASCSDFVIYPTGKAGGASSASVVAFDNLYTGGCSGAVPSVYWAYNTGGTVTTAPVISLDGSQVAFVQVSGTTASLVVLKWAAGSDQSVGSPQTLSSQTSGSLYRSCTAPCMYTLAFSGAHNDSISAPYYDFVSDNLYVGDDSGNLHQFTGVFNGDPAENGSPWPVNLGTAKISSPVLDCGTGRVIVGDLAGTLHSVTAATGAIYGTATGLGDAIADAPLLDGSAEILFVFVTASGSYSWTGYNAIYEFPTSFTSFSSPETPGVEPVSAAAYAAGSGYYLYSGMFDNVYFQSANETGNIYVVGGTGTAGGGELYRVGISGGGMTGSTAVTNVNSSERPWPSPVAGFCNGACTANATQTTAGTDYIFFSVNRGNKTGCTNAAGNGCVLAYNVSNPAAISQAGTGLNVTTPGTNGCWATTGMVIDNSAINLTGAQQIYFINFNGARAGGTSGATSSACTAGTATLNAVQASQANP